MILRLCAFLGLIVLAACASAPPTPPQILAQFDQSTYGPSREYRIGASDLLTVTVYQVEDLTFDEIRVNSAGDLQLPLIGSVRASGLTTDELSTEIAQRLSVNYLRNPRVSVSVKEAASEKVAVDGAVTEPGVFEMKGRTTLLQAVAMAKGPVRTADLNQVVIFRTINGERMAARFDLAAIRRGELQDPLILGDDTVVVGGSFASAAFRDLVAALPSLALFASY